MPKQRHTILPLTDKNLEDINKLLWKTIKQKNMEQLYTALDPTIKQFITYEAMKRYINEGLKKFNKRKMIGAKESEIKLKIRITAHQFLLNNMLSLLKIRFEDLFSVEHYEHSRIQVNDDIPEPEDEEDETSNSISLLQSINRKIDKLILLSTKSKSKSYVERYLEVSEYLSAISTFFLSIYNSPEKQGFAIFSLPLIAPSLNIEPERVIAQEYNNDYLQRTIKMNQRAAICFETCRSKSEDKPINNEVYAYEYYFLEFFINQIHKKSEIHKLYAELGINTNTDTIFGRLLSPFFVLAIFFNLLNHFLENAKSLKKSVFSLLLENEIEQKIGNEDILEYGRNNYKKLIGVIEYILSVKTEINIDETLCVYNEILFSKFFLTTKNLFKERIPIEKTLLELMVKQVSRKPFEKKLSELYVAPGNEYTYYINSSQYEAIKNLEQKIEDAQIKLEDYYTGNEYRSQKNDGAITPTY